MKKVLIRFRTRLQNGEYDNFEQLTPLLTPDEVEYIEEQIHLEEAEQQHRREKERRERLKKATPLIKKFPDKECLFGSYYGEKELVCTYDGTIDFDPEGYKSVVGADRFTYDEYLEVRSSLFTKHAIGLKHVSITFPWALKAALKRIQGKGSVSNA